MSCFFVVMAPLFLLLLLLFSSFHGVLSLQWYEAGNANFSTQSNTSNSSSASFWLSEDGNLTFGFKTLGLNQYLLSIWMTADTNKTPIWWPNINNSFLTQGSTLTFTSHGSLDIFDANQSIVWSAPTSSNASLAKLQNTGNLQLLDHTMENILWQSFSDLRDTLIVRPRDNNSTNSLSSIIANNPYLLQSRRNDDTYTSGRFHAATNQDYDIYLHALDQAYDVDFIYLHAHIKVTQDFFELSRPYGTTYQDNSSMPMSMLRLDPDGNLRIYAWNAYSSTWDRIWQFTEDPCMLGSPCGPYSICKAYTEGSLNCTCPSGYQAIDTQTASLGCYNNLNLSSICDGSAGNTSDGSFYMAANPESSYFYNDISSYTASDLEACKQLCLKDCDCIAAAYRSSDNTCNLMSNTSTWLLMNGYATSGNTLLMKLMSASSTPGNSLRSNGGVEKGVVIRAVMAVASVVILGAIIVGWVKTRGTGCRLIFTGQNSYAKMMGDGSGPIRFTYQNLVVATHNFSDLLGEGSFGNVYKGRIEVAAEKGRKAGEKKHLPVAVKVLKITAHSRHEEEAEKQFRAEVSTLGKIHHVNLVNLLGYYIGEGAASKKKILVYDYMENGSLAEFLSDTENPRLSWRARYSIALGAARGIAYLHHDCYPPILHSDIKPHNLLLHHDFTVKVADFGLARRLEEMETHLTMSAIRGTRGYMAPEWLKTKQITPKADVYSYGMVLLELVRGFHERGSDDDSLVNWAYQFISSIEGSVKHRGPHIPNREDDALDEEEHRHLHSHNQDPGNVDFRKEEDLPGENVLESNELQLEEDRERIRLLKIGLRCIQQQPHLRPSMLQIVQLIEGNGEETTIPPYPAHLRDPSAGEKSSSTSSNLHSYLSGSVTALSAR